MDVQKIWKFIKKIIFLPSVPTLLIAVPSFAFVIWVLMQDSVYPAAAYAAYLLSAYAMVISITGMAGIVKWVWEGLRNHPLIRKILGISFVERYLKETAYA